MERFLIRLQGQAEENPMLAIAVGVTVLTAASKFINAAGEAYDLLYWSKEVARRSKNLKR